MGFLPDKNGPVATQRLILGRSEPGLGSLSSDGEVEGGFISKRDVEEAGGFEEGFHAVGGPDGIFGERAARMGGGATSGGHRSARPT